MRACKSLSRGRHLVREVSLHGYSLFLVLREECKQWVEVFHIFEVYAAEQYARSAPDRATPGLLQHYAVYQTMESPREGRARRQAGEYGSLSSRSA